MILIIIDKTINNHELFEIKKIYNKQNVKFLNFKISNENIHNENFIYIN